MGISFLSSFAFRVSSFPGCLYYLTSLVLAGEFFATGATWGALALFSFFLKHQNPNINRSSSKQACSRGKGRRLGGQLPASQPPIIPRGCHSPAPRAPARVLPPYSTPHSLYPTQPGLRMCFEGPPRREALVSRGKVVTQVTPATCLLVGLQAHFVLLHFTDIVCF